MTLGRWLVSSALLTLACGAREVEPAGELSLPIVEGETSGAEQDSVVMLRTIVDDVDVLCSGTLVAPSLVLTARHCVSYLGEGLFSCSVRGELLERDPGAGRLGRHLPAEDFEIYGRALPREEPLARGREVLSTLSSTICTNDLAFLVLDRELDLPLAPLRLGSPAKVGEPSALVGYGLATLQEGLDYTRAPRRQRRDIAIVGVGPDTVGAVTSVPPRAVILDGPSGCTGDSGGPLLAEPSGAVLGVYSLLKGEDCARPDVSHQLVHVPAFGGLVEQAFTAVGHEPVLEHELGAGGASSGGAGGAPAAAGTTSSTEAGAASAPEAGGAAGAPEPGPPESSGRDPDSSCAVGPRRARSLDCLAIAALLSVVTLRRRRHQRRPSSGSA